MMLNITTLLIEDVSLDSNESLLVKLKNEHDAGLAISLDGYSTKTSVDGFDDAVLFLEYKEGKPVLCVWGDINSEEPTHTIDLSGARIKCRLITYKGNLYYLDDEGVKNHIADFEESATTTQELEQKVLDLLWDSRLDSAGCSPHFEYEEVLE